MFGKRRKRWEELSTEDKLNWLKMEHDQPSVMYVWVFFGIIIIVSLVMSLAITNAYITDLYYQTGIELSPIGSATISELSSVKSDLINGPVYYAALLVTALYIISIVIWYMRWHKFNKSMVVKKR